MDNIINDETRQKLREPLPPESIKQHPTKSFLSTIKAIYITERLNDVFGIGGWNFEHEIINDAIDYIVVCGRIWYVWDQEKEKYKYYTPKQYGGHKKTGTNTEPADGYKSAVTDCISKCASYLEIGIDVFKGKTNPPKQGTQKKEKKDDYKKLSDKQWGWIKKIARDVHQMTDDELRGMVSWKADKESLRSNHWKMKDFLLPEENFQKTFIGYSEAMLSNG